MIGTDIVVARLRNTFANDLWTNVTNRIYYATTYRNLNKRKGGIIPEVFIGDNEYQEVRFDDKYGAMCFFDLGDEITDANDLAKRSIRAIFAVNLKLAYPSITYRAEEEAHRDVLVSAKKERNIATPNTIISGLDAYGDLLTDDLKRYNMQPWHVFALDLDARIDLTCDIIGLPQPSTVTTWFEYPFPIIFGN